MLYQMGLYDEPYNKIATGLKTIEVRLYDEKRRKLRVNDRIEFTKLSDESEKLQVEIVELHMFPTFREMYEQIPAAAFGATDASIDRMVESTYRIYTPEQEKKWGTIAIKIKKL
ncbi:MULTISPECIES: ASCH domain-containing protein [unclassified Virgibacillus]|uniref:ASCH domain-containing protein n=1 Tax=unclassified Virgibacillus TaxID=2620237 RepID=UPI0024DE10FB|nr:ASCH domain-containing protein [Virgibacillus sp. LDC-1]